MYVFDPCGFSLVAVTAWSAVGYVVGTAYETQKAIEEALKKLTTAMKNIFGILLSWPKERIAALLKKWSKTFAKYPSRAFAQAMKAVIDSALRDSDRFHGTGRNSENQTSENNGAGDGGNAKPSDGSDGHAPGPMGDAVLEPPDNALMLFDSGDTGYLGMLELHENSGGGGALVHIDDNFFTIIPVGEMTTSVVEWVQNVSAELAKISEDVEGSAHRFAEFVMSYDTAEKAPPSVRFVMLKLFEMGIRALVRRLRQ
jgi:hypothetical protein